MIRPLISGRLSRRGGTLYLNGVELRAFSKVALLALLALFASGCEFAGLTSARDILERSEPEVLLAILLTLCAAVVLSVVVDRAVTRSERRRQQRQTLRRQLGRRGS